jgi:hypothetical protein
MVWRKSWDNLENIIKKRVAFIATLTLVKP